MLLGMRSLAFLLAFVFSISLFAQAHDPESKEEAKCDAYERAPLPTEASMIATPKQWPECASYKLYSGIGMKVDFEAARKCAWAERSASQADLEPRYTVGSVFGGSAMLTVLYANGEGVKQSIPLALRFACEAGGAPTEVEDRTASWKALQTSAAPPKKKFDFRDDITSGFIEGFCAAYGKEFRDSRDAEDILKITEEFTPIQRTSFAALLKAENAYAKAVAAGEVDLSGTARGMYEIDAEQTIQDNFLAAVKSFEVGELPTYSVEQSSKADAELNRVYRRAVADAEASKAAYNGAVQPEGIRAADRLWLKNRDAWLSFAALRYSKTTAAAWLTLLSRDRISTIQNPNCDLDGGDEACEQYKSGPLPLP